MFGEKGVIRYALPISIGRTRLEAMLDTGSTGLRVLPGATQPGDFVSAFLALPAGAVDISTPAASGSSAVPAPLDLPPIIVTSSRLPPPLHNLTEPVLETPQTILVVPPSQLQDQNAMSYEEAVEYISSVNVHAQEDHSAGDQLYVRGFSAQNDNYMDGMLDIGKWYRDTFDMSTLEVLEGPSGVLFGRGSTGGVVNYVSKTPTQASGLSLGSTIGSDQTKRQTVDFDQAFSSETAIRLNALAYDGGTAGRDVVHNDRFAVAPSVAFGMGTANRLTVSYLHQNEDDIPDYGLPWLDTGPPGAVVKPADVARANYYGFKSDFVHNDVDVATVKYEHDFSGFTLRDQLRYGRYARSMRLSEPTVDGVVPEGEPLSDVTVTRAMQGLESLETDLDNQLEAVAKFNTGSLQHSVVAGLEATRQTSDSTFYTYSGVPTTNLLHPDGNQAFTGTQSLKKITSVTVLTEAAYGVDTVHFADRWSFTGAVRVDNFDANYTQSYPASFKAHPVYTVPTWRAALEYEPTRESSVYVAWGTSFDPSAEALSLSPATAPLPPESSDTVEAGTKWRLGRVTTSLSVFQTTLTNLREVNPLDPTTDILVGVARVQGLELDVAGRVTPRWRVFGGYTYLPTAKVVSSPNSDSGGRLQNTPVNSFKLWNTYDLTSAFSLGVGVRYVGQRTTETTLDPNGYRQLVPGYVVADLMVEYRVTRTLKLQLNVNNVADAYYFDGIDNNHVNPGAGRAFLLKLDLLF
ncbi:MAG: TonB-dependent receptor [Gammaproteobacteria bacterium]